MVDGGFDIPEGFFDEAASRNLRFDGVLRGLVLASKETGARRERYEPARWQGLSVNLVVRGRGRYLEDSGESHELQPGTIFHRYPGVDHTTEFGPQFAESFIVFDRYTGPGLITAGIIATAPVIHVGTDAVVLESFRHLVKRVSMPEAQVPSRIKLLEAIAFIGELYDRARRNRVLGRWERIVEDACLLLDHNLDERFRAEELSAQLGVTYAAFRKHFRDITGYSPIDYRIRRRLESAQQSLLYRSVSGTAKELGYSDPYAFSAQFKAFLGLSPRQFQRRIRRKPGLQPLVRDLKRYG
jgi:AraC-like DNA-binding protein